MRKNCEHEWAPQDVAPIAAYLSAAPDRFESARLCPKCGTLEVVAKGHIKNITTNVRVGDA